VHLVRIAELAMAEKPRAQRPSNDIDISTRASQPKLGWRGNFIIWGGVLALFALFYYFELSYWTMLLIVPLLFLAVIAWFVWVAIYKRGAFTWMRLAMKPAKLMAAGDAKGAELAFRQAMERANRFEQEDHRRGIMLCELAMFVKHQGRQAEAVALYEESVAILAKDVGTEPLDYFIGLNNYGICFIHVKDYEAAQRILEKAVDMILAARKREADKLVNMALTQVQALEFVLRLNLAFLFLEMRELHEAELQLRDADVLAPLLPRKTMAQWNDHYAAICAMWEFHAGNFGQAEKEIARAKNPEYPACLRMRCRLHMVRMQFDEAETLARKYQEAEKKRGVLHRPEMLPAMLDFAEALHGNHKPKEAFDAFVEARSIVIDFDMPADASWGKTLERWLKLARESNQAELADMLEKDLAKIATMPSKAITILDKFKERTSASS
jgi:tetratricopeptide (TPR) repeat protein